MAKETPYRAVCALLEGLAGKVPLITFSRIASPYYQQVPEPRPAFPYAVFDLPFSSVEHVQMSGKDGGVYIEKRTLEISIYGDSDEIEQCAAPEWPNSLFHCLDSFSDEPEFLDGLYFDCIQFVRKGYELKLTEHRDETGVMRIWEARATWDFWTEVPYPIRKS